jgi:hypothetical protein
MIAGCYALSAVGLFVTGLFLKNGTVVSAATSSCSA